MDLENNRIYGQNLTGIIATDITEMITVQSDKIVIPDKAISLIGRSALAEGDLSEAGMVMKVVKY